MHLWEYYLRAVRVVPVLRRREVLVPDPSEPLDGDPLPPLEPDLPRGLLGAGLDAEEAGGAADEEAENKCGETC